METERPGGSGPDATGLPSFNSWEEAALVVTEGIQEVAAAMRFVQTTLRELNSLVPQIQEVREQLVSLGWDAETGFSALLEGLQPLALSGGPGQANGVAQDGENGADEPPAWNGAARGREDGDATARVEPEPLHERQPESRPEARPRRSAEAAPSPGEVRASAAAASESEAPAAEATPESSTEPEATTAALVPTEEAEPPADAGPPGLANDDEAGSQVLRLTVERGGARIDLAALHQAIFSQPGVVDANLLRYIDGAATIDVVADLQADLRGLVEAIRLQCGEDVRVTETSPDDRRAA